MACSAASRLSLHHLLTCIISVYCHRCLYHRAGIIVIDCFCCHIAEQVQPPEHLSPLSPLLLAHMLWIVTSFFLSWLASTITTIFAPSSSSWLLSLQLLLVIIQLHMITATDSPCSFCYPHLLSFWSCVSWFLSYIVTCLRCILLLNHYQCHHRGCRAPHLRSIPYHLR